MDKPVLVVGGVICAVANCDITDDGGTAEKTSLPVSEEKGNAVADYCISTNQLVYYKNTKLTYNDA